MKLGIVGLPNVGKSTLFNSITKAGAECANYPFCTIEPNVGVVAVPDERLDKLTEMYKPEKTTHAVIEFVDIAGLVKGASRGEGLGNKFLSHIRETDAIVEVVRCFEDSNVVHVDGSVNPLRDIDTINLELIFADIETVNKRLDKVIKKSYDLLGLMSFLTAGEPEVRAWTIKKGTKAPQAAGKIHSDIERGFIKAEVVSYDDLMREGSMVAAKEKGLVRSEGKEYIMQDGDIVLFKFNV